MKIIVGGAVLAALVFVGGAPTAQGFSSVGHAGASSLGIASTNVPGRFCKKSDVGKKIKTARYGTIECKREGNRARWKRA